MQEELGVEYDEDVGVSLQTYLNLVPSGTKRPSLQTHLNLVPHGTKRPRG